MNFCHFYLSLLVSFIVCWNVAIAQPSFWIKEGVAPSENCGSNQNQPCPSLLAAIESATAQEMIEGDIYFFVDSPSLTDANSTNFAISAENLTSTTHIIIKPSDAYTDVVFNCTLPNNDDCEISSYFKGILTFTDIEFVRVSLEGYHLDIHRCIVSNVNSSIAVHGSTISTTFTHFRNNNGGALAGTNITVSGSAFYYNYGGAINQIFSINGKNFLTVNTSRFENNYDADGGAISVSGAGSIVIEECSFINNTATNGNGGALAVDILPASTIFIDASNFTGNSATGAGGAIYFSGSPGSTSLSVTNSVITENVCGLTGGGIWMGEFAFYGEWAGTEMYANAAKDSASESDIDCGDSCSGCSADQCSQCGNSICIMSTTASPYCVSSINNTLPCGDHGYCKISAETNNNINGMICVCYSGWDGDYCNSVVTPTETSSPPGPKPHPARIGMIIGLLLSSILVVLIGLAAVWYFYKQRMSYQPIE